MIKIHWGWVVAIGLVIFYLGFGCCAVLTAGKCSECRINFLLHDPPAGKGREKVDEKVA